MKKVLVLGATGAMGRYLVPELVSLGYEVTGVALDDVAPWQGMARLFRRITDNSKVLALTGLRQEDMISLYDGLKLEIGNIPKDFVPKDTEMGIRMDEYLKEHGL